MSGLISPQRGAGLLLDPPDTKMNETEPWGQLLVCRGPLVLCWRAVGRGRGRSEVDWGTRPHKLLIWNTKAIIIMQMPAQGIWLTPSWPHLGDSSAPSTSIGGTSPYLQVAPGHIPGPPSLSALLPLSNSRRPGSGLTPRWQEHFEDRRHIVFLGFFHGGPEVNRTRRRGEAKNTCAMDICPAFFSTCSGVCLSPGP